MNSKDSPQKELQPSMATDSNKPATREKGGIIKKKKKTQSVHAPDHDKRIESKKTRSKQTICASELSYRLSAVI